MTKATDNQAGITAEEVIILATLLTGDQTVRI